MSSFQKVKAKDKIKSVKGYLNHKYSVLQIAAKYGVEKSTVYWWIEQYKSEGETAFTDSPKQFRQYSNELKEQAVKDYLGGGESQASVCKKYGIRSKHQLRDWITMYNTCGNFVRQSKSGGGSYMSTNRSTTFEERAEIVLHCIGNNRNYGLSAKEYNVGYQQVRNWVKKYDEYGLPGLEDRRGQRKINQEPRNEIERLEIELEKEKQKTYLLTLENALLKKVKEVERRNASHK